ncbi:porin [Rhizobium sp. XQZ8]|uniref:porin n=1 Tax=Rhizobium populisoli TaxID=2859785 RepID=UPI001C668F48|nr:porin [Rhizobium populisoli]MBW6421336.1 porin [Rhizobium populisoli]
MNIKSLLLGSAAALAAVSGAQAADAIVAAEPEPMEYVRVCDAFGTGFFYIPGTETCLKIGGYVRFQINWDDNNDVGDDDNWDARTRALVNFDARTDTELGTLRSFIELRTWAEGDYNGGAFEINEAYITVGGFKVGYGFNYWDAGLSGETDDLGSNRVNMVGYEYKGDTFSAGIFVDELTGLQDGNPLGLQSALYAPSYAANDGIGIEAQVSGKFGAVSAQLLGGYDFNTEEGAVRGIMTAGVGPGEFGLAGVWASGPSAYYDRSEWAVAVQYAAKFGKFTVTPAFQYYGNVGYAADGDWLDNDAWRAGATLDYAITSGLSFKTTVNYTKVDDDGLAAGFDDDSWTGFVRLQRTF